VLTVRDGFLWSGDRDFLEQQRRYLLALTETVIRNIGADGREELAGWRYLDWATRHDPLAVNAGYQALAVLGLRAAAELLDILGESDAVGRCREAVVLLGRHRPALTASRQANALLVLAGLAEPATAVLPAERSALFGLTPFLGHAVLDALALAGDWAGAYRLLREFWGAMIDLGATTYWEDFDLAWVENAAGIDVVVPAGRRDIHADFGRCSASGLGQSLCHAWSAGPTAWLSRYALGAWPAEPGCGAVRVRPQLGDLTWAEGIVPTPRGDLHVRHRREADGTVTSSIDAPAGVTVVR
jgi:alpha-L-rhamnosidase